MPPSAQWNSARAKVQLRLSVQRLRTLQQKKEAQAKASRRDIATLIERGKIETARIKVESIIHEDIHVELLELLELYCELLLARFGMLDQPSREPDPAISEGVISIIYAAPRTELKELHVLRLLLMEKFGRAFSAAVMDNSNNSVSERIVRKLDTSTPAPVLVDGYMTEIAKGYGVAWSAATDPPEGDEIQVEPTEDTSAVGSQEESANKLPNLAATDTQREEKGSLNEGKVKTAGSAAKASATPPEDEFEVLSKRFAALKKK